MPARLALPVVVLLCCLGLLGWSAGIVRRPSSQSLLVCPPVIDLGPRGLGEVVEQEFAIANHGTVDLVLADFRTSCTCSGLEILEGAEWVKAERLTIPAGGQIAARVRLIVRGRAATSVTAGIRFSTNMPDRPEAEIQATVPYVRAGLIAFPSELNLGPLDVASPLTHDIDVYDDSPTPGTVLKATGLTDGRVTAEVIPPSAVPTDPGRVSYGTYLGRVRVSVAGDAGQVRQTLVLAAEGRPGADVSIPVAADIGLPVVVIPGRLAWPPASANMTKLIFRSRSAAITGVSPLRLPPGANCHWSGESGAKTTWIAELSATGDRAGDPPPPARFRVTLADGRSFELEVTLDPRRDVP